MVWPLAGFLGGIGFTMSLFIATLALPDQLLDGGKLGTLIGSAISAVIGLTLLAIFLPRRRAHSLPSTAKSDSISRVDK